MKNPLIQFYLLPLLVLLIGHTSSVYASADGIHHTTKYTTPVQLSIPNFEFIETGKENFFQETAIGAYEENDSEETCQKRNSEKRNGCSFAFQSFVNTQHHFIFVEELKFTSSRTADLPVYPSYLLIRVFRV